MLPIQLMEQEFSKENLYKTIFNECITYRNDQIEDDNPEGLTEYTQLPMEYYPDSLYEFLGKLLWIRFKVEASIVQWNMGEDAGDELVEDLTIALCDYLGIEHNLEGYEPINTTTWELKRRA